MRSVFNFPFSNTFCKCVNGEDHIVQNKHNREGFFITIKWKNQFSITPEQSNCLDYIIHVIYNMTDMLHMITCYVKTFLLMRNIKNRIS